MGGGEVSELRFLSRFLASPGQPVFCLVPFPLSFWSLSSWLQGPGVWGVCLCWTRCLFSPFVLLAVGASSLVTSSSQKKKHHADRG